MKLGHDFPEAWKKKSKIEHIGLADLLYAYIIEDFFLRIEKSSFQEYLFLQDERALEIQREQKGIKNHMDFFYLKSERKSLPGKLSAGQELSPALVEHFLKEIFSGTFATDILWDYKIEMLEENSFRIQIEGNYLQMKVPFSIKIEALQGEVQIPKKLERPRLFEKGKSVSCLCYSKENVLGEDIFEMMKMLELISDMEVYHSIYEIIQSQSISGRHVLEELEELGKKEPKVLSEKRLEQIASYKKYAYMKKRWQQYRKRNGCEEAEWEGVIDHILRFVTPVWRAVCNDEIFFDDWMPEIGRFLG